MNFSAHYFSAYRETLQQFSPLLGDAKWLETFNEKYSPQVRLVENGATLKALEYEEVVSTCGAIPTRVDSLHDLMNASVWMRFPLAKRALNSRHIAEGKAADSGNGRSRVRDAMTLFDEVGAVLICSDASLHDAHRRHDWNRLFVENRSAWHQTIKIEIFGHGLLESLALRPHRGLIAKALWVTDEIPAAQMDNFLARTLADADGAFAQKLRPLPVFGVPGWCAENFNEKFYENADIFRPLRR